LSNPVLILHIPVSMAASSEGMSPLSPLESLQSELDSQFLDDPEETGAPEGAALPESSSGCQKQSWQPEAELAQPQAPQLVSRLEATPPPKRAILLEATPSPQPVQASVSFEGKGDEMPPMPPGFFDPLPEDLKIGLHTGNRKKRINKA
jgi:hypothetical protein